MTPEEAVGLLGTSAHPGPEEVQAAFRRLAAATHPDRGGRPGDFRRLLDARAALADRTDPPRSNRPRRFVRRRPRWTSALRHLSPWST